MALTTPTELLTVESHARSRPTATFYALAAAAILIGLVARIPSVTSTELNFHPSRQFHSALIARKAYFWAGGGTASARSLPANRASAPPVIEPPVIEGVAALGWLVTGGEHLWVPKLFSALCYLGACYLLARELAEWLNPTEALLGLLLAVTVPFGVVASTSFQPDPFMTALMLLAITRLLGWGRTGRSRSLMTAALLAGLAGTIKPSAPLMLGAAIAACAVLRPPGSLRPDRRQLSSALVLLALPEAVWVGSGLLVGWLHGQTDGRTFPSQLIAASFWGRWVTMCNSTVTMFLFALAVLGVAFVMDGLLRRVFVGLLLGFGLFGLVFDYHIVSHSYYSLPLLPVAAFAVGAACRPLCAWLRRTYSPHVPMVLALVVLLPLAFTWPLSTDGSPHTSEATSIGAVTGHTPHALFLSPDDGSGLKYFGQMAGDLYPSRWDRAYDALQGETLAADDTLLSQYRENGSQWFVAENSYLKASSSSLREALGQYPVALRTSDFVVYDLRS